MNAVLGFSELLATDTQSPLTEDQLESVEQIIGGGKHLLSLIDDVLDLSKIESGHSDIHMEIVDINSLLTQVIFLIQPQAEQYGITIANKVPPDCSFKIQADDKKLKQILLNLSSNAIKYNSENGVLTISCAKTRENKIRVSVSDTGNGVSKELFPSLFEPFNRLDKANSNIQGTGIGLSICKQLVKQMNGDIGVFNNSDKGLTFWVEFEEGNNSQLVPKIKALNRAINFNFKFIYSLLFLEYRHEYTRQHSPPLQIQLFQTSFEHNQPQWIIQVLSQ